CIITSKRRPPCGRRDTRSRSVCTRLAGSCSSKAALPRPPLIARVTRAHRSSVARIYVSAVRRRAGRSERCARSGLGLSGTTALHQQRKERMQHFLLVFVGAGLGGAFRHGINLLVARGWPNGIGVATLIENVLGCFLMGVLVEVLALKTGASQATRLFL